MSFKNKVVIVTGAANGIGKAIAKEYAANGAKVVVADLDELNGKHLVEEIARQEGEAFFLKTDVGKETDVISFINQAKSEAGTIDILINNAGVSEFKSPYKMTVEEWDRVINTNLRSVFLCSREAAKHMRENEEGGAIVNIASTRASMSEPNSEAYAASKGGIVSITHALAASFTVDKITVNAISPGWIQTENYEELREIDHEQHLSKRVGKPKDIARACLYLTDNMNDFITGANLVIDGGMTRKMIYEH
ncbi:SDR family NAD(P)-dependent oxidoreductase [Pseudalkalibacillus salsuginis]|uniref:SDR family NAD(P)-dependent oxidoreductase n=1 Tax=Pseudalkalibacillus salsuginis TaxID=2910972 RepID=UPI001F401695|nr:glucose 1-dehydrogenase [Pseudalkalibacillus salsuginis]MCF6410311.1 SDR family oxidoreductase [Pseudalkalibacillus salsuginis]